MAHRCLAVFLALLVATPALAQDLRGSIQREVAAAAAQQGQSQRSGMHPGFLWTGVGLLGLGGLYLGLGAAEDPENETCVSGSSFEDTCLSNRTVLLSTGAVMAGVGALLLIIGAKKANNAPSVAFSPGKLVVQQSIPLGFGR
jgi:hypothetical protein